VIGQLQEKLGVKLGETTQDGLFTLEETECLAACTQAPVLMVNDETMHVSLTRDKVDTIVEDLQRKGKK
jgi:NADH-quinone oxidoreductase subunit E